MAAISCSTFSRTAGGQASLWSPSCPSSSYGNPSRAVTFTRLSNSRCCSEKSYCLCGNVSFSSPSICQLPHRRSSRAGHEYAAHYNCNASRNGPAVDSSLTQIPTARHGCHWRGGGSIGRFSSGLKLNGVPGTVSWVQQRRRKRSGVIRAAYISAPGAPADEGYYRGSETEEELAKRLQEDLEPPEREDLINGRLVRRLIFAKKKSLLIVFASLVAGTCCTLSMPIFSGRFFETLIGVRKEPVADVLAKLCVVYVLEPIFTVLFVTNMIQTWEEVMRELRFRVFERVLIQKVEFFDEHKVGELTSLLSSDLGAIKDVVNENVSRDRGFRALFEVLGVIIILFVLSPQMAPVMSILMVSISGLVGK